LSGELRLGLRNRQSSNRGGDQIIHGLEGVFVQEFGGDLCNSGWEINQETHR
jgi:hypothetical protein